MWYYIKFNMTYPKRVRWAHFLKLLLSWNLSRIITGYIVIKTYLRNNWVTGRLKLNCINQIQTLMSSLGRCCWLRCSSPRRCLTSQERWVRRGVRCGFLSPVFILGGWDAGVGRSGPLLEQSIPSFPQLFRGGEASLFLPNNTYVSC